VGYVALGRILNNFFVMIYLDRIEALRKLMLSRGWDAVLFTGSDPHSSEYPAERWKQVRWLTGFTGECGDVVLTPDHAGLWTDTRYFIQANEQLEGTGVELHKLRVPEQVPIPQWLAENFSEDFVLAVDGYCVSASFAAEIENAFLQKGARCEIVSVPDLLSILWTDRPKIPQTPIFTVNSGESRSDRLQRLREFVASKGCSSCLISALDEIAWLLNLRASDIEYNPLVISYLLVEEEHAYFYVLKGPIEDKSTEATFDELGADGIELRPYSEIEEALRSCEGVLMIDSRVLNRHLYKIVSESDFVDCPNPIAAWKAVKNRVEISGMRQAHFADGLAMEKFLYWIDKCMENERAVSEWDAAVKLGSLRAEAEEYQGDSFETISAYGAGAALPHYMTPLSNAPVLKPQGLYLCDSGGQYYSGSSFGGTTDITRTIALGPCTPLEMEDYTLVLKGHIGLAMSVFPLGTPGCRLDALARAPLWAKQRNFGHGTGHGVGWFLGVHEGPHDVRQNMNAVGLEPGMIISDEPGIYREGQFGIRHENLLLCVDAGANDFGKWCRFEVLTLCHFDTSPIVPELLTPAERDWLNTYNARVYSMLAPELPAPVAEWLRVKTKAI
jgi:Xaa-Pro aminopeptidase